MFCERSFDDACFVYLHVLECGHDFCWFIMRVRESLLVPWWVLKMARQGRDVGILAVYVVGGGRVCILLDHK